MLRFHVGGKNPKYEHGKFLFDENYDNIAYSRMRLVTDEDDYYKVTQGFNFRKSMTPQEELVFRNEFQCVRKSEEDTMITIKDIRNLVLFLMPEEFLNPRFLDFVHTREVHWLWHALIIYFDYYLKVVEFILIRRDETTGGTRAQIQSTESNMVKQSMSDQLARYRLLIAREYSIIIKGDGPMARYYHTELKICNRLKDRFFFEHLFAVSVQIVWIALYRRAFDIIEWETMRLFGSDHFTYCSKPLPLKLSTQERALLYGRNYKRLNYCQQMSPLAQELINVSEENKPILWFGVHKYRGTNKKIAALELEYIVPESQLRLINVMRGILGKTKYLFNTLLQMDCGAVRDANFSKTNDPYSIVKQPFLEIPDVHEESKYENIPSLIEHFYRLKYVIEPLTPTMRTKWLAREIFIHKLPRMDLIRRTKENDVSLDESNLAFAQSVQAPASANVKLPTWKKPAIPVRGTRASSMRESRFVKKN